MSDQNLPATKLPGELKPGDRIRAGWLPTRGLGEVLFAAPHVSEARRFEWFFVVYRYADGYVAGDYYLADAPIPFEPADKGMDFTDLADRLNPADDPTPVSPARVAPHTGGVEGVAAPRTVHAGAGDAVVVDDEAEPVAASDGCE